MSLITKLASLISGKSTTAATTTTTAKVDTTAPAATTAKVDTSKATTVKVEAAKPAATESKVEASTTVVVHVGGDPVVNGEKQYESAFTKSNIIYNTIAVEGGYVNNPNDSGGETNFGITYATANKATTKKLLVSKGWDGTMRNLTKDLAYCVYEIEYWNKLNLDAIYKISPFLADKLFDQGVNCGTARAAKWLQRSLNALNRMQKDYKDIVVDGGIGNATLTAINGLVAKRGREGAVSVLLISLLSLQGNHYITTGEAYEKNEDFMYGWLMERLTNNVRLYFDKK